jgi:uncharacterized protein YcgI (DUF1989 family)
LSRLTAKPRALARAVYPFDAAFYTGLFAAREGFELVSRHVAEPMRGFGFRVEAGDTFRFVMREGPQIIDVCFLNADDPTEYYATGPQLAIEGGRITRFTRIWGTPPLSRPLATCIADTVQPVLTPTHAREHICHTDCCTAHLYYLYRGVHHRPCYDNIREGLAMVGRSQRSFHGNANLFMKSAIDPSSGNIFVERSDAKRGDYMEFYAEIALHVAFSVCPAGPGGDTSVSSEEATGGDVLPVGVEIRRTGIAPLEWPYEPV